MSNLCLCWREKSLKITELSWFYCSWNANIFIIDPLWTTITLPRGKYGGCLPILLLNSTYAIWSISHLIEYLQWERELQKEYSLSSCFKNPLDELNKYGHILLFHCSYYFFLLPDNYRQFNSTVRKPSQKITDFTAGNQKMPHSDCFIKSFMNSLYALL